MDDLKQAYKTLGLPEDATREQVEQRYFILLKKAKAGQVNLEEINRAYRQILGFEEEREAPAEKQGKLSYFFYYYKFHVIAVLVIVLVAAFTIKDYAERKQEEANKPPLDLSVTVYGNFFSTENSDPQLAQNLLSLVPEWKRIDVGISYIPKEIKSQQDMAMQQKGMLTLATEKMDLLILDERDFQQLAKQGAFLPLDGLSLWKELSKTPDRIRSALDEEKPSPHPYGVDITDHPVFKGTVVAASEERKIIAIRANPPHKDKAVRLMELLTLSKYK